MVKRTATTQPAAVRVVNLSLPPLLEGQRWCRVAGKPASHALGCAQGKVVLRSPDALPPAPKGQLGGAVEVQVVSPSLPTSLQEAMAQEVHRTWLASLPGKPASVAAAVGMGLA